MKPHVSLLSTLICLFLLLWVVSCKKADDPAVTPGGTTPPGSTTSTTTTKSTAKDIKTFTFAALSPAVTATIDATAKTISATVTSGTDVTKLVPTITLSDKATVSPATGVAQDFTKAVTYTVTAEDGTIQAYIVTVSVDKPLVAATVCRVVSYTASSSTGSSITTYELDAQNRLAKYVTISSSSTAITTETYDADGYRTQEKTTYNYTSSNKYNSKDQITTDTYSGGRLVKTVFAATYADPSVSGFGYTYEYGYDAQGAINKLIYDGDETTTFANGVITGITSKSYTYEQNTQGFVTKKTATDGSYTLYKYSAAGQQIGYENYTAKGVKTAYYIYENGTVKVNVPTNPLGYKGQPTVIPSAYGASGGYALTKRAYYTVDASGKETLNSQFISTWQVDSRGNLTSSTFTSSGAFGSPTTTTTTYQYEGCK